MLFPQVRATAVFFLQGRTKKAGYQGKEHMQVSVLRKGKIKLD